jgi:hypothetical protein
MKTIFLILLISLSLFGCNRPDIFDKYDEMIAIFCDMTMKGNVPEARVLRSKQLNKEIAAELDSLPMEKRQKLTMKIIDKYALVLSAGQRGSRTEMAKFCPWKP